MRLLIAVLRPARRKAGDALRPAFRAWRVGKCSTASPDSPGRVKGMRILRGAVVEQTLYNSDDFIISGDISFDLPVLVIAERNEAPTDSRGSFSYVVRLAQFGLQNPGFAASLMAS